MKWHDEIEKIWDNMIKQQMPEKLTDSDQEAISSLEVMNHIDLLFCGLKSEEMHEI